MGYRYGFNGKEKDESGEWGNETHYDYGFRIYNPSIGKFLSVDPLTSAYPFYTPYQFAANTPIFGEDLDGLEVKSYDEGDNLWQTAQNIQNAQTLFFLVEGYSDGAMGGLDGAPKISTVHLDTREILLSRQEIYRIQTEQIRADINKRRARAQAESDLAYLKAQTANPAAMVSKLAVGEGLDYVSVGVDVYNGDYKSAVVTASLILLPGAMGKTAKRITNKSPNDPIPLNGRSYGKVTKTSNGLVKVNGESANYNQWADFVVDTNGELQIGNKHQALSGNGDVLAAGRIKIRNGKIVGINNSSGHYRPSINETDDFAKIFEAIGYDVKGATVETFIENSMKILEKVKSVKIE